ncbi:MAG: hypothetical protein CSA49_03680 [Gammaproteobacteria bacterium]|nr:MAG: hypothetical protein CSA49_03680 [Gammaproteobacteria bacterium]
MQISRSSVNTSGFLPANQRSAADARVERRVEVRARTVENEVQHNPFQLRADVVSAPGRDEAAGFRRVVEASSANKQYAFYASNDQQALLNSQKKALQAYAETEIIGRVDADVDYLGSVDIFI